MWKMNLEQNFVQYDISANIVSHKIVFVTYKNEKIFYSILHIEKIFTL